MGKIADIIKKEVYDRIDSYTSDDYYRKIEKEIITLIKRCNFPYNTVPPQEFKTDKEKIAFERGCTVHFAIVQSCIAELEEE